MPERFVGKPSSDGVSQHTLDPAPATPAILVTVHDAAFQHGPIRLKTLPNGFKAELIQAAERGQVRTGEGSVGHVEVFRMGGIRTSIIGRPRPSPGQRRANPFYTLNCEEPAKSGTNQRL
jgi:hypothetical protein